MIYKHTDYCTIKYLNYLIEQDHVHIKHHFAKSVEFQIPPHDSRTIKGIDTIHVLYKYSKRFRLFNEQ